MSKAKDALRKISYQTVVITQYRSEEMGAWSRVITM